MTNEPFSVIDPSEVEFSVKPDLKVGFVMISDFTLMPVAGFVESLRFAADQSFRSRQLFCSWSWLSIDRNPIKASCGLEFLPQAVLGDPLEFDYIVVTGGLIESAINPAPEILTYLRQAFQMGVPVIGLCSGSFVLAEAGLLDNRLCSIHYTVKEPFAKRYPKAIPVIDQTYVIDQNIITCPGGTAIELAAELISRHCGKGRAKKGLDYLLVSSPSNYSSNFRKSNTLTFCRENQLVESAIRIMSESLSTPFSVKQLASILGSTERQLNRMFCASLNNPPATYWRNMRLDRARDMMLNSTLNVTQISYEVGFSDASHFTLWFKKRFGETPCRFRKRRQVVDAA